ncbi:MAG: glycosyltransferase family 4 protein [Thermoanaerobaculia bacterium]|nr:glycosyltransferase family 4 protein [Thermoanaerobaculia bacterium]MBP9823688.1 glycosyltransferase family 4 protein [Thermoanaerobaculia bacterium]
MRGPLRRFVRGLARRRETARRRQEHEALLAELSAAGLPGDSVGAPPRLLAIGSWEFPVYSQSFVYQELAALVAAGFDVRIACTARGEPEALPPQCATLAGRTLRLPSERQITRRDLAYFRRTRPAAVTRLLALLAQATGRSAAELAADDHLLRAFSFARIAEAWGADLVHSYFFYEGSLAAFVAQQLLGLPRGITCYADHLLADYRLKLVAQQLAVADLVVATSERARRELVDLAPACAPRTIVKPNAVDGHYFDRAARVEPAPGEPFRLLSVARIDPKKGLQDLLAAAAELGRREIAFELELVGGVETGSEGGELELAGLHAAIAGLGLGGVVALRGFLPAAGVRAALAGAHLFVAPYVETARGDKDGIPTAVLEAMATGLAVVATRSGSLPELIADGGNGRLVEPGSPAELAAAIAGLLAAPGERARLGEAAARTVRERFSIEVCEPELARRLGALADGRRTKPAATQAT